MRRAVGCRLIGGPANGKQIMLQADRGGRPPRWYYIPMLTDVAQWFEYDQHPSQVSVKRAVYELIDDWPCRYQYRRTE